jgi:hypothetical protein
MVQRPKVVGSVEQNLDERTRPDHGRKYAAHGGRPTVRDLEREQEAETEATLAGPGVMMTPSMAKGMATGSLIGGLVGAVVLGLIGLIPIVDMAVGWRVLMFAAIGAVAGGTAMAMYMGGRMPELDGEARNSDNSPGVGTTMRDRRTDERGR